MRLICRNDPATCGCHVCRGMRLAAQLEVGVRVVMLVPVYSIDWRTRSAPPLPGRIKSRYVGDDVEFFVELDAEPGSAVGPIPDHELAGTLELESVTQVTAPGAPAMAESQPSTTDHGAGP